MAVKQYLDYEGLTHFYEKLEERYAPIQALQFKGTVATISSLPTVADEKPGYVYNVTQGGTTTADFVDDEQGKTLQDGENVVVVNVGTDDDPDLRWDILGGVFDIEDRLQFGLEMPDTNLEDGRTFLYLGATTYEYDAATPTGDEDPSAEGWYELNDDVYTLTTDTSIESGKTYYVRGAEEYVTGVIYRYNTTQTAWEPLSSGDNFFRITESQIDALFE